MPIPLDEITPGYYIARRKGEEGSEFIAVVWGISPFMQVWSLPLTLSARPHFVDVQIAECEFLARLDEPAQLAAKA